MNNTSSNNSAIYLKFGALPIACDSLFEGLDESDFGLIESHYQSILQKLKDANVVTDIDAPKKCKWTTTIIDKTVSIYFRDPIKLSITLPDRHHQIALTRKDWLYDKELDLSSKYNLLFDGVCFAYFREITKQNAIPSGAADAREQLNEILNDFTIISTFPNPLRQSIILRPNSEVNQLETKFEVNDLIIDIPENISIIDIIYNLFHSSRLFLMYYYDGTQSRAHLQSTKQSLQTHVQQVLTIRSELQSTSWHNFNTKSRIIESLESECSGIIDDLRSWYSIAHELEEKRRRISAMCLYPLNTFEDKLFKELDYSPLQTEYILKVIEMAQHSITQQSSSKHLLITALAALISAITGALIGGFWVS